MISQKLKKRAAFFFGSPFLKSFDCQYQSTLNCSGVKPPKFEAGTIFPLLTSW
jgi:hypothetical protein